MKAKPSTMLVSYDVKKGITFTFKGPWNRKMVDRLYKKMVKGLKEYKLEMRRKEDDRGTESSGSE